MSSKKTSMAGLAKHGGKLVTCGSRSLVHPVTAQDKERAAWGMLFAELKGRGINLHEKAKHANLERAIRAWADASMDMRLQLGVVG